MSPPLLRVRGLQVDFPAEREWRAAVRGVDLDLDPGEVLAVVGESGAGKTTVAMALLGLLPEGCRATGSIQLRGRELVGASSRRLREVRGEEISVVFQEPATALNPVYPIGFQIEEMIQAHRPMSRRRARARIVELLRLVELPDPERMANSYPHQLSGGQRQRAMIAMALALEPGIVVADEPTSALDVTVQAEILDLLSHLRERVSASILLISHDLGVVADLADRVAVMRHGLVVETGTASEVFGAPQHSYTRQLLATVPHLGTAPTKANVVGEPSAGEPMVELAQMSVEYPKRGRRPAVRAVRDLSLRIGAGEVVGLVGESGSGKTTVGRALVGLLPLAGGMARVAGVDLAVRDRRALLRLRRQVGFVFQDPGSSLNPRLPIAESVSEPLRRHTRLRGTALAERVATLLEQVQLPALAGRRYPHELSGGERQRVGIARALALNPPLVIADEPTSALDVSVQARILELFQQLQREHAFACLFISHDLAVVEQLASRLAVMRAGRLVEVGATASVLGAPSDPYTRQLIDAVPVPDPQRQRARRVTSGETR